MTMIEPTKQPNAISATGFFGDPGFDFVTRSMIGYAAQGVMDIGQVFATIARIEDGNADSWYAAWRSLAEKLHGQAKAQLAAGHGESAHRLFLAASERYAQAVAFADGQTDRSTFMPTFALQTACWESFVDSSARRIERIAVPYEGTSLPGFLFRPDASDTKRPTLVMTNGSEGSKSGLWAWGVNSTLARGWNAFIYDGPGQQNMLNCSPASVKSSAFLGTMARIGIVNRWGAWMLISRCSTFFRINCRRRAKIHSDPI